MFSRRVEIFLEFLIFGLVVGIIEDLIAIKLVTGEPLTWHIFAIAGGVALPFAVLGEVIVDRKNIIPVFKKQKGRKKRRR